MYKILVVDDEKINLMFVKKILSDEYEIEVADSGEEALQKLEYYIPTLILLDIHMPGIDGYETIKKIKSNKSLTDIPVIFLSADDDSEAEVKGFELGADDFIRKPFVSAVVKRRVERSIEDYILHRELQIKVERQTEKAEKRRKEIETISVEIIQSLATAIDAKDIYTKGHSSRVAEYSAILAKKLGWNDMKIEKLRYKALLHDVGKIGIPDRVLNKNGRLTDEEYEVIKSHTIIGSDILNGVSSLSDMYLVARHHHERYDGKGYPDGLAGEKIPLEARVVGIADAYDAMSSDRVYRKALPKEVIRDELVKGKGTQFDPEMLDLFLELFESGEMDISKIDGYDMAARIDISKVLSDIISEESRNGAIKLDNDEMARLYNYINNVHKRYGIEFTTMMVMLEWDESVENEDIDKAMKAMEYSIIQSLRSVDIVTQVSRSQFLIVLTGNVDEGVQNIIERLFSGFYRNCQNEKIKPVYEIK